MLIQRYFFRLLKCSNFDRSFVFIRICMFPILRSVTCFICCDFRSRCVSTIRKKAEIHHEKQYLSSIHCMFTMDFELEIVFANRQ